MKIPFLAPIAVVAAALSLAGCASGGPTRTEADHQRGQAYRQSAFLSGASLLFVQFDANKDYVTTREEVEAGARAEWTQAAGASDKLTPIQFEAWAAKALGGPNLGPYRLAFDSNVNNEITAAEFSAAILAKFDFWDKDKDGRISRADMIERLPEMRRPNEGGGPGGGQGMPREGQRPPR